jgi:hypothetical protein
VKKSMRPGMKKPYRKKWSTDRKVWRAVLAEERIGTVEVTV